MVEIRVTAKVVEVSRISIDKWVEMAEVKILKLIPTGGEVFRTILSIQDSYLEIQSDTEEKEAIIGHPQRMNTIPHTILPFSQLALIPALE